jgi:carboxypeptidase Taq
MDEDLKIVYKYQKDICTLYDVIALLQWDSEINLPIKAIGNRSMQLKIVNGLVKEKLFSKHLQNSLDNLKTKKISKADSIIINEFEKLIANEKLVPKWFSEKSSKKTYLSENAWKNARKKNDYNLFKDYLKNEIELKKKYAKYINKNMNAYDVLLLQYDDNINTEILTKVFDDLKIKLIEIRRKVFDNIIVNEIKKDNNIIIQDNSNSNNDGIKNNNNSNIVNADNIIGYNYINNNVLDYKINIKKKELKNIIGDYINKIGLDVEKIKLNSSVHPFTLQISQNDIRFTTRYSEPIDTFFSTIHEASHALYDSNLPEKYINTFIYQSASFSMDETIALFFEFFIAKSHEFWDYYFELFKPYISNQELTKKEFYKSINKIKSSLIRTNSDEIGYCLHIILRFEIERDLFNGVIKVENLKEVWNQKIKEYFGINPKNDNEGILQDDHWASGDFGYFPVYLIGLIYASNLFKKMLKDIPDAKEQIKNGEFNEIISWLKKKVFSKGKLYTAYDIVKSSSINPFDTSFLIEYLDKKYSNIYDVK